MQTTTQQKQSVKKTQQDSDIVSVILEDHKSLKELIKVMKDSEEFPQERVAAFEEFVPLLTAHAKPEEEILYAFLRKNEELKEEVCEGEVEHEIADQLVEEIKRTTDLDMKAAKVKVLAELVEHHIEEEEEDLLPDYRKQSESSERSKLGNDFLDLKLRYLAAGDENIISDPKTENMEHQTH